MDLTYAGPQQFVLDCYPDQTIDYDKPPGTPVVRLRVRWRGQGPPTIVTSSGGSLPPLDTWMRFSSGSAPVPMSPNSICSTSRTQTTSCSFQGPKIIRVEIENDPMPVGLGARYFDVCFHKKLEIAKQKLPPRFPRVKSRPDTSPSSIQPALSPRGRFHDSMLSLPISCLAGVDPNQSLGPLPNFLTRREW